MCNSIQRGLWGLKVFKTVSAAIALMAACVAQANAEEIRWNAYAVDPAAVTGGGGKKGNELNIDVTLTDQFGGPSLLTVKKAKLLLEPVDMNRDYTDETSFSDAALFIPLDVEGFNIGGDPAKVLEFDDIIVTSCDACSVIDTEMGSAATGFPTEGTHLIFGRNGPIVTFTFSKPINAFGIDVLDFGDHESCGLDPDTSCILSISIDGGPLMTLFDTSVPGNFGNGNLLFAGYIDTGTAFSSVTLSHSGLNGVGYDRLQFGSVARDIRLVCYDLKDPAGGKGTGVEPKVDVVVHNQFNEDVGNQVMEVKRLKMLCVRSAIEIE